MANEKEQKSIHFNTDFLSSRVQAKPKVHVNPAFFQKSQAAELGEQFLKTISTQLAHINSSHHVQKQVESFLHVNGVGTLGQCILGPENNTCTSSQRPKVKENDMHSPLLKEPPSHEHALGTTKSYVPTVNSSNYQKYHNINIHSQTGGMRTTQYSTSTQTKKGRKSCVYSWKAGGTKFTTDLHNVSQPINQKIQTAVFSDNSSSHKFYNQNFPNRKALDKPPIEPLSKVSRTEEKMKINSDNNKLPVLKHKKNNLYHDNKKYAFPKTEETVRINDFCVTGTSDISKMKNSEFNAVKSSEAVLSKSKVHSEGEGRNNMGKFVETSKTVTQNSRNSNILINPKLLRYLSSNGSQDKISKVSAKPQYNLSHSSIIANADGIASLSTLKNNNTMVISEASKRNGKFKVLSKTKLVRRRSTSSSSQTAVCGVHPRYNVTKTTPEAFKKNGKYKVVSKTKLVRRLSGSSSSQTSSLSIQPKIRDLKGNSEALKRNIGYRVISKTKLVRQSSDSSSRHAIEVAAKTKSSETSSLILPYYTPKVKSVPRPLKFPTRTRRFSTGTRANVKRRYSVMSPTKLIRSFSNTSSSNGDGISGKPRYFIKTDTKLVRRCSQSSTSNSKSLTNDEETKTNVIKSVFEKNKKFSILSKTKLVRRKSESGMNKTSKLLKNTIVSGPGIRGVQTIIKRHKLVRNARAKSGCWSPKILSASGGRNINTVYKIVNNCVKLSSRQKAARGIISKYKINRLKLESSEILRKNDLRNCSHLSKPEKKYKFSHTTRKGAVIKHSDRIINIGGILYKSTKTSLRKQLSKTTQESAANASENECIVWLRGDQFQLSAGGRTLKRVKDGSASSFSKHSLPRVHIGGLTYSRTKAGQYELTQTHQARAVVSSAKQRSMMTLSQRKKKGILQKRNEHCIFFNRFGRCTKKDKGQCPYIHDPQRVAICTRFLRGRCPVNNCPFSHTVDPDKMPVCSHFVRATCTRDGCPYRHVRVNPFAPICLDFLRGHCLAGEECKKQHVLVCEEFSRTGKCPRGLSCPLSHHRGRGKFRKSVTLEPADGENKKHFSFLYRKRKRSESTDVLGELKVKRRTEKKFKENAVKVVKQRYFHIPTHGEDDDEEKQKTVSECTQSYGVKTEEENRETKLLNKQKDNSTPVTSSQSFVACAITLQEKQMPHIHESREEYGKTQGSLFYNKSSNTLDLEEIRQRILQKVDKIKYLYSAHKNIVDVQTDPQNYERYNVKKETYLSFDKTDQPSTVGNREEIHKMQGNTKIQNKEKSLLECVDNATDTTESDMYRLQRAPLPQRLPSYIPLSMDEEAEDL